MKENGNKKSHSKVESWFYFVLLLITMVLLFLYFLKKPEGNQVEVRVSGKVIGTYSLNEDKKVIIEDNKNGKNILIIKNGKAKIEEADCPDKICIKKGEIYRVSESIICLPHEVVVEIKRNDSEIIEEVSEQKEDDVDVIAK